MSDNPRVEAVLQSSVQARVSNLDCDIGRLYTELSDCADRACDLCEAIDAAEVERGLLRALLTAHPAKQA